VTQTCSPYRQPGQGTKEEVANRDLKAELQQRERLAALKTKPEDGEGVRE
jgi:hypothetical protein